VKQNPMKKKNKEFNDEETMRDEYHFDYSKAVWGKHAKRLMEEGANVVTIQPDVFEVFPDSESVNAALRGLIEIAERANAAEKKSKNQKERVVQKVSKPKRASTATQRTLKSNSKP
jgi:hypothetical protein